LLDLVNDFHIPRIPWFYFLSSSPKLPRKYVSGDVFDFRQSDATGNDMDKQLTMIRNVVCPKLPIVAGMSVPYQIVHVKLYLELLDNFEKPIKHVAVVNMLG
jgi:hypothetical protein